jgi:hypothetical protein
VAGAQPVTLRALERTPAVPDRTTTTDDGGRFEFAGLGGGLYQVLVVRQGVGFQTPVFALGDLKGPLELRVYDVTERDPGLRVDRVLLTLDAPDAGRQELAANQLLTLVNPGTQAYRPGGGGEPMTLMRFALPPKAHHLVPVLGLEPESVVKVDRGFGTTTAVPPGEHEFGFSYRFPYNPGTYAFDLAMPYGAASVRLLIPAGAALDVGGPDLVALGEVAVGGRRFRTWGAQSVPPGGRLVVELRHLPARPLWQAALEGATRPPVVALAYAALLALAAGWALQRPGPAARRREQAR